VTLGAGSSLRSQDLVGGADTLLSQATEIGRGVFGTVYRASVQGRVVAVKKLATTGGTVPSRDDFDREVRVLGKARHPNLLPLKGYYWTPQTQLLITDYAPHGSLEKRLHSSPHGPPLTWAERFRVVSGTARGLAHLHQAFRPPVIHYDVKPSNVLLDERCNPAVSDFGLARLLPRAQQTMSGYVAPELACRSLRVNEKCDIYGFGVLVLELVTGRRAVEYGGEDDDVLVDRVRALLEHGNALDCVDPGMGGEFPEEEALPVLKLGMVCASQIPSNRPSMAEVVQILQVIKAPVGARMGAF
jgi:serine/threonine protein kinase